ncbi:unnamed protein product, partial [Musa hybrid cultivar]
MLVKSQEDENLGICTWDFQISAYHVQGPKLSFSDQTTILIWLLGLSKELDESADISAALKCSATSTELL